MTLDELKKEKNRLEFSQVHKPGDYADAWLELAEQYAAIDARANEAYCLGHYRHYRQATTTHKTTEEAPRYSWQDAENMGGG